MISDVQALLLIRIHALLLLYCKVVVSYLFFCNFALLFISLFSTSSLRYSINLRNSPFSFIPRYMKAYSRRSLSYHYPLTLSSPHPLILFPFPPHPLPPSFPSLHCPPLLPPPKRQKRTQVNINSLLEGGILLSFGVFGVVTGNGNSSLYSLAEAVFTASNLSIFSRMLGSEWVESASSLANLN